MEKTKQVLFIIIAVTGLSCNSKNHEHYGAHQNADSLNGKIYNSDGKIRFDFSAHRISTEKAMVEINAILTNTTADTAYFLSSSCDGNQYSLKYDTSKFRMEPRINCNASWPLIEKIAPKSEIKFETYFRNLSNETKIKLGFDFYQVEKSFDKRKLKLLQIYNRGVKTQNIIWANEKTIE
jgi:hypothetical protein